eukprot:SM000029S10570  [mRNA]  locus=s29:936744:940882:+ [translate_table: standard]
MGNKLTKRRHCVDERLTRPQGLYLYRDLDHRKLRKLILDGKLAPCYLGSEEPALDLEECPICFLQYPSLNRSRCCCKAICTECFLQMKPPQVAKPTQCPFCKAPGYAVEYRGAQTQEEKGVEQLEEQKVIEAKIRMRQQELDEDKERARTRTDSASSILPMPPVLSDNPTTAPTSEAAPHSPAQLVLEASRSASGPAWGLWSSSPNRGGAASATGGGGPHNPHPVARGVEPDSVWSRSGLRASAGEVRNPSGSGIQPSQLLTQSHAMAGSHAAAARMQFGPGAPAGGVLSSLTGSHRQRAASVSQSLQEGTRTEGQASVVDDPDSSTGIEGQSQRRSEVFDLDFDDIMLMEAIWQSLREQELQRHVHTEQASPASVRTGAGLARADILVGTSSSGRGQSNVSESMAEWMREREMLARSSVDDLVPSNLRRSQSRGNLTGLPGSQQSIGAPLEKVERSGASSSSMKESMEMSVELHGEYASQPRPPAIVAELFASSSLAAEGCSGGGQAPTLSAEELDLA